MIHQPLVVRHTKVSIGPFPVRRPVVESIWRQFEFKHQIKFQNQTHEDNKWHEFRRIVQEFENSRWTIENAHFAIFDDISDRIKMRSIQIAIMFSELQEIISVDLIFHVFTVSEPVTFTIFL